MAKDFSNELNSVAYDDLTRAGAAMSWKHNAGVDRYSFYRRRGYCRIDAFHYALVWCRNSTEQQIRRKAHLTGCV